MNPTYKEQVVESALQGLVDGGFQPSTAECFRALLELMYACGYKEALRNVHETNI